MTSEDLNSVIDAEKDAMSFMKEISNGINDYYEYGNRLDAQNNKCLLINLVSSSTYDRLDNFVPNTNNITTIRNFIISKIDI